MDQFIGQLITMQRRTARLLGGVFGSLLGILIIGGRWIEDEGRRWRDRFDDLKDRVAVLEKKTSSLSISGGGALTASELQALTASNISGAVANSAIVFFTYTVNDLNRVAYHQLRVTASGAVAVGTIGSVRWGTPLTSSRAPELTTSYQNNTSGGAAKLQGLIPTFNSLNQNTGYDIDSPIALANTDVIDMGVRVREIAA